jgi:hypothetical protein
MGYSKKFVFTKWALIILWILHFFSIGKSVNDLTSSPGSSGNDTSSEEMEMEMTPDSHPSSSTSRSSSSSSGLSFPTLPKDFEAQPRAEPLQSSGSDYKIMREKDLTPEKGGVKEGGQKQEGEGSDEDGVAEDGSTATVGAILAAITLVVFVLYSIFTVIGLIGVCCENYCVVLSTGILWGIAFILEVGSDLVGGYSLLELHYLFDVPIIVLCLVFSRLITEESNYV